MKTEKIHVRMDEHTLGLLKALAEKENRSLSNMVETLIKRAAYA